MSVEVSNREVNANFQQFPECRLFLMEKGFSLVDTPLKFEELHSPSPDITPFPDKTSAGENSFSFPVLETQTVKNVHGHDIRRTAVVTSDGTTVFDHQPLEDELYSMILERIEPGEKTFEGYPYPVTILPSKIGIFYEKKDAIGNRIILAEAYLLGSHYQHGIGEKVPAEQSWSVKKNQNGDVVKDENGNPIKEEETRAFLAFSTTPYKPRVIHVRFLRTDSEHRAEFVRAKRLYEQALKNEVYLQRMKQVEQRVALLRQERMRETRAISQ